MVNKNNYYDLECVDFTHEGLGVCKIDNFPIFVPNFLPGEVGQIKIVQAKKNYAYGRLIELKIKSPNRVEPPCPIYKECGGCNIQHMSNELQKEMKTNRVKQAFKRIANLDLEVHDCITMENPWHYRNKVAMPIQKQNNEIIYGFYRNRTHEIIKMSDCLIQNELSNQVINTCVNLFNKYNIEPYNETTLTGNIRHIVTRFGYKTQELMMVFVTNESAIKNLNKLTKELVSEYPQIKTVVQNINNKNTNVIMGNKENIIYGDGFVYDYLDDIKFKISSKSFYQVNPIQTEVLYNKALELADLTGNETVIDAYCGIGTISLFMASKAKHVYGVEIVEEAIVDAKENAKINNIKNVTFEAGDAEAIILDWKKQNIQVDVVMVDPPRKGCSAKFLETMVELEPKRIVYVSCDVSTQARDVKYLVENGYKVHEVYPVDLFPQTYHVESVLLMTREDK